MVPPVRHPSESDSEDDPDYVPPADHVDAESSEEENNAVDHGNVQAESKEDTGQKKKERDALWASFQASVTTPTLPLQEHPVQELVKIEKRYLFAGKHVTEVVDVPAGSEDAKKWPLWQPSKPETPEPEEETTPSAEQTISIPTTSDITPAKPASERRTGPRKPRTMLPSIPTLGSSKAKKITTLDKSAMDWRTHVTSQSSDVQEELVGNRRGGGYLEKVDFLQRVEGRKQDVLEANKSFKRRKI